MLLGFTQYFKRFIKDYSKITHPLRQLLTKDTPFEWNQTHDKALEQLKRALLSDAILAFPDMNEPFIIQCDASKTAAGHALLQMKDGILRPIAFGGRGFKKHEMKLSATDLELLSLLHAIETYHQFISNGRPFRLLTDHCSLQYLQNLKHSSSSKLYRYSLLLQQFNFTIQHIKGQSNVVADFLSRYPLYEEETATPDHIPDANSIEDIDHFSYLNAIDAEAYVADSEVKFRDPAKKRRRNYRVYEFMPLSVADSPDRDNEDMQQVAGRKRKRKGRRNQRIDAHTYTDTQTDTTNQRNNSGLNTDEIDEQMREAQNQVQTQIAPVITLESQRDDVFFAAIIDYLQDEKLPSDRNLAQRILYQIDDFFIQDNQLWHLAPLRVKDFHKFYLAVNKSAFLKVLECES